MWSERLSVGNPSWVAEFGALHHWALLFPFILTTSNSQVLGLVCRVAPVATMKPKPTHPPRYLELVSLWALQPDTFMELDQKQVLSSCWTQTPTAAKT